MLDCGCCCGFWEILLTLLLEESIFCPGSLVDPKSSPSSVTSFPQITKLTSPMRIQNPRNMRLSCLLEPLSVYQHYKFRLVLHTSRISSYISYTLTCSNVPRTWFQASGSKCRNTSPSKLPTAKLSSRLSWTSPTPPKQD